MCGALATGFGISGRQLRVVFRRVARIACDELREALRRLGERALGTVASRRARARRSGYPSATSPASDERLDSRSLGAFEDAADDLAGERRRVDEALAGDDEIGLGEASVEAEPVGDEVEAGEEARADRREPAREPSRRAGAGKVGDDEPREPLAQDLHLLRRRSLLRREDVGGVEEARIDVARDVERDEERMRDGFRGADPAVGRRDAADRHDDPLGPLGDGRRDELADAAARRAQRVVPLRPAGEREPARLRGLDQRGAVLLEPPGCFDRLSERTAHERPPVSTAEHVERALAAVRERQLVGRPAGALRSRGDRGRGLARGERAAELVGSCEKPHHTVILRYRSPWH